MRRITSICSVFAIAACSYAPPRLNESQFPVYERLEIIKKGEAVDKEYIIRKELSSVSCSNSYGARTQDNEKSAMHLLRRKAALEYADAIINVSCGLTAFVNNCWSPTKCTGTAVVWK
jgi:uncharacterized protein YbjQ (UPF0145 family)